MNGQAKMTSTLLARFLHNIFAWAKQLHNSQREIREVIRIRLSTPIKKVRQRSHIRFSR